MSSSAAAVTRLLRSWQGGDRNALEPLMEAVYAELRRLADRRLRGERRGHTLQPTELVHEAFLRLVDSEVSWSDRTHFFAVAARTMRRVLVDHARARGRQRRGGGAVQVTLDESLLPSRSPTLDLLDLDNALSELAALDAEQAQMIELYHFGGLTLEEISDVCDRSIPTVHRRLKSARAWLAHRLAHGVGT